MASRTRTKPRSAAAPPADTAAPGLRPRPKTHWRNALLCSGVGIIGAGAAPILGHPDLATASVIAGGTIGVAVAGGGSLRYTRNRLRDRVAESLAPLIGSRGPDRRSVQLRKWSRGWPGTPAVVKIRYGSAARDTDPAWSSTVCESVGTRLDSSYRVATHDPRRCVLVLELDTSIEKTVAQERKRIDRTITDLLGSTAKITDLDWDEGKREGDESDTSTEGKSPARICVSHEISTKLAATGYRARVERTLSSVFPGRWRARWDLQNDSVVFEIRPSFPSLIEAPKIDVDQTKNILETYDEVRLPFGEDEDGKELTWAPAIDPNLMVVGAPGTGKTVLEHTILASVAQYGWPIWVVDGKSIEFLGWRDWPNVQVVATTVPEQIAVIERAWQVMEHRYQLIVQGRAGEDDFEPLMVFLDEFADFRANLMDWYAQVKQKGDPRQPPVLAKAASIARKGRSSRVHLLFATQRPDAEYFGGDMRDNFRMRISMGRLSAQGAMMMWQDPTVGVTLPRGKRGRATTINDANRAVEVQTYFVPDPRKVARSQKPDQQAHLDRLRPAASRHERLLIRIPEDQEDLDTGEILPPSYREVANAEWVLASEHPELDPVVNGRSRTENATELASPLTLFQITGRHSADPVPPVDMPAPETRPDVGADAGADRAGEDDADPGVDQWEGYGPEIDAQVGDLSIGDLVLVDEATDQWAVIDAEPGEDLSDPSCMAIPWRNDADEEGLALIPDGEPVRARRALINQD